MHRRHRTIPEANERTQTYTPHDTVTFDNADTATPVAVMRMQRNYRSAMPLEFSSMLRLSM
jgi:hypothetical protein